MQKQLNQKLKHRNNSLNDGKYLPCAHIQIISLFLVSNSGRK